MEKFSAENARSCRKDLQARHSIIRMLINELFSAVAGIVKHKKLKSVLGTKGQFGSATAAPGLSLIAIE